jgi:hypothetical protein
MEDFPQIERFGGFFFYFRILFIHDFDQSWLRIQQRFSAY